ncbi:hypothetical protein H2O64_17320 [Kordia sp. YSTF-M3]|uniref:Bacteriocin n=1 Tax=Kordia aestuariivivens TaxID=2759037 RepID=A0ABR7QD33_9FLAO|nr:hypothetical protein [Kordia aestuariivivens]MBC8756438.1 hypothetical protein [Kordia aestuariivivens]
MKKRAFKKISLQKTLISSLQATAKSGQLFGGFGTGGTSPKCGTSELESCHGSCNQGTM